MNRYRQTQEIIGGKLWQVKPQFAHAIHPLVNSFLMSKESRSSSAMSDETRSGWFALKSKGYKNRNLVNHPRMVRANSNPESLTNGTEKWVFTEDPEWDTQPHWYEEEGPLISPDDEFIDVIDITSSITRYGGWCSAGSIEHRDQMIFASKFPNCIGHLFIVDSPGGSAYAKNDYQQGIEAARAVGQPVLTWIDGGAFSAAVAASCQTDEVYVQHPNSEIGCIGTMAAFYTIADGKERGEGYVYHEKYDPESYNKNEAYREIANNDEDKLLLEELAADGAAFRQLVKTCRPAVREDMLHGNVYKASEVMGILVDGVKSFDEVVQRIVELHGGNATLISHNPLETIRLITYVDGNDTDDEDDEQTKRQTIRTHKNNKL